MIKIKMIDGTLWYYDHTAIPEIEKILLPKRSVRERIEMRWSDGHPHVGIWVSTSPYEDSPSYERHYLLINPNAISYMEEL